MARGSSNQRGTLHSPIPTLPLQSSSAVHTKLGTTPPTPPITHPIKMAPDQHTSERGVFQKLRSGHPASHNVVIYTFTHFQRIPFPLLDD